MNRIKSYNTAIRILRRKKNKALMAFRFTKNK